MDTLSNSSIIIHYSNSQIAPFELQQVTSYSPVTTINSDSDISSLAWSEDSFENKSDIDANSSGTDSQIKEKLSITNKHLCIKRKKIIIFTTIAILILVIIIMIATMIPRLNSKNTLTSKNSINDNDHTESALVTTAIISDVVDGPPCSSYTVINDPLRNIGTSGIGGACDDGPLFNSSIGGRWIRFIGVGGTVMPSTSPGRNHCGAYLAGWFNVTLPSTIGTIVNGLVCFEHHTAVCGFFIPAKVVNCADFYVYFLSSVNFCNARYCTT